MSQFKNKTYIHNKTGNEYEVLFDATNATNAQDGESMVVYQNNKGQKFARELSEFLNKFTPKESLVNNKEMQQYLPINGNTPNFNYRLTKGEVLEKYIHGYLLSKGIDSYINKDVEPNYTPKLDLKYGDLTIAGEFKADIKSSGISKKSFKNFKGDYYIVANYDFDEKKNEIIEISEISVFNTDINREIINKILHNQHVPWAKFPSGDQCLYLPYLKGLLEYTTFDEWIKRF